MHHGQVGIIPGSQEWPDVHKSVNVIHPYQQQKKTKKHMIISIDAKKAFGKIQHPFMIKPVIKEYIKGTCINIVKVIYEKQTANNT